MQGKPWDPTRKIIEWDGTKWTGGDVPDIAPTAKPEEVMPFHHERRRHGAALCARPHERWSVPGPL